MDCVSNVGTRADFAESRLADIRLKLQSEKDAAVADALRKAQAEAEATVARIKVRSCMVYGAACGFCDFCTNLMYSLLYFN